MEEKLLTALQLAISYLQIGKKDQQIIDELKEVAEQATQALLKKGKAKK